jgi:membrane protease YdiL (CAAX protease family)
LRGAIAIVAIFTTSIAMTVLHKSAEEMKGLGPKSENLVDIKALVNDPVYLLLGLTVISFGMGGLREELWRAGVLAGLNRLKPGLLDKFPGQLAASSLAAIAFGLGHLPQGWTGVGVTALIGLGLGMVMLYFRSMWVAAFAHGFFDAASFGMIYLLAKYSPDLLNKFT